MTEDGKNRSHAELLSRFSNMVSDIAGFKSSQWQTTYYSSVLSGAMLALLNFDHDLLADCTRRAVILTVVVVVSIAQAILTTYFQASLARALEQVRERARAANSLLDVMTHLHSKINQLARLEGDSSAAQATGSKPYTGTFILFGLAEPVVTVGYSIFKLIVR
jgi:hypothetical protein